MTRLWFSLGVLVAICGEMPGASPNVVVVMTDDQGLGDFSFTGNPVLKTPAFDAFAKQSLRLTDFHVCPMCSPTRGQLMTGLSALRNGATSVTAGRTFLRPGLPTLPEAFAAGGYKAGLFGKWHLGDHYPHRPMDKGFREAAYHLGWGQQQSTPEFDHPLVDGRYFHNGAEKRYKGHCTDLWFDLATAWMKERKAKGEPFLCYLPTNAPHAPCIDLDEYVTPYKGKGPAGFFGMIAHLDKRFGDLMRFLDDEKLAGDTIVVFMTDNGGTAGVDTFNAGLRGRKTQLYEGGHRVPCWVRWPKGNFWPRDVSVPTQVTDLLPTLCELCGLTPPAGDALYRGHSLVGLLRAAGGPPIRRFVVQYGQTPIKHDACVVYGRWRLVRGVELYDVEADRAQKTDLAAQHPDVVAGMRQFYEGWWAGVEPLLTDFVPISLGARQQPVVEMTSGDWQDIYADNSGYVREAVGGPTGGVWHVKVEEAGEYTLTLRRWPEQTGVALGGKHEPSAKSPANKKAPVTKGFPTIAQAHAAVGGVTASGPADAKATGATLTLTLPAGKTTLKAWFADAAGQPLCGAFFVTVTRMTKPAPKPNLLVMLADDLGWSDCSMHGGPAALTPNMTRVAAAGMTFSHAFVASPSCAPSRAALLTGLDPMRTGAMLNHSRPRAGVKLWPAYFQELGYEVVSFGKTAHYAQVKDYGFDHASHFTYHADDCVDAAASWLRERKPGKPLCLLVGTNWPHVPWPAEPSAVELPLPPTLVDTPATRTARGKYAAAVARADRDLGAVFDAAAKHLGRDALFLFSGDHGSQFPFGKWNLTDAGVRTPLLAVWPGRIPPGSKSDALVSWLDILPTCLEAAGGRPPAELNGRSLAPLFAGGAVLREQVFLTHSGDGTLNRYPVRGVRTRTHKYVRNLDPSAEHHTHVNKAKEGADGRSYWDSWAEKGKTDPAAAAVIRRYHTRPAEELYDVAADPWELRNLAADPAHGATLTALRTALDGWMQSTGDKGMDTERALWMKGKK